MGEQSRDTECPPPFPHPEIVRSTLAEMVELIVQDDFESLCSRYGLIELRPADVARAFADYEEAYGVRFVRLPREHYRNMLLVLSWENSAPRWWDCWFRLYTDLEREQCDLCLILEIYEEADGLRFVLRDVRAP